MTLWCNRGTAQLPGAATHGNRRPRLPGPTAQPHRVSFVELHASSSEALAYEQGVRPEGPPNAPELLVVGMDGGRSQAIQRPGQRNGTVLEPDGCGVHSGAAIAVAIAGRTMEQTLDPTPGLQSRLKCPAPRCGGAEAGPFAGGRGFEKRRSGMGSMGPR